MDFSIHPQKITCHDANMPAQPAVDITFIANAETRGDGCNIATMDFFFNVQNPWLSLIIPVLRERHLSIEVVDWEDPHIDWKAKKIIIVGPIWGYVTHIDRFIPWLEHFPKDKAMHNSAAFIQWNVHKKYLLDLQSGGIAIPETAIVDIDSKATFEEVIIGVQRKFNHTDLIIKGCVDAAALGFRHLKLASAEENRCHFEKLKSANYGVILQPFMPEIQAKGELCATFFAHKLSHMFVRVSAPHEERVQRFYGGRSFHFNKSTVGAALAEIKNTFRPDLALTACEINAARKQVKNIYKQMSAILHALNLADPIYVRIDGVMIQGLFTVMEIEGIEPDMEIQPALAHDPTNNILERYADAILA